MMKKLLIKFVFLQYRFDLNVNCYVFFKNILVFEINEVLIVIYIFIIRFIQGKDIKSKAW